MGSNALQPSYTSGGRAGMLPWQFGYSPTVARASVPESHASLGLEYLTRRNYSAARGEFSGIRDYGMSSGIWKAALEELAETGMSFGDVKRWDRWRKSNALEDASPLEHAVGKLTRLVNNPDYRAEVQSVQRPLESVIAHYKENFLQTEADIAKTDKVLVAYAIFNFYMGVRLGEDRLKAAEDAVSLLEDLELARSGKAYLDNHHQTWHGFKDAFRRFDALEKAYLGAVRKREYKARQGEEQKRRSSSPSSAPSLPQLATARAA
jgi:hypothetical protein